MEMMEFPKFAFDVHVAVISEAFALCTKINEPVLIFELPIFNM